MTPPASVFIVSAREAELKSLSHVVEDLGYQPSGFTSAESCLEALRDAEPLAVLIEFEDGPVRGDECCRRIKEQFDWKRLPVLMVTDGGQAHEVMYCWRAAADDFIVRPVSAEKLGPKLSVLQESQGKEPARAPSLAATCLLVEPSRFVRKLLGGSLEQAGIQVLYASEGAEALDLLKEHGSALDACVVDLGIQDMNPVKLLEQLRAPDEEKPRRLMAICGRDPTPTIRDRVEQLTGEPPLDTRQLPFDVILGRIYGSLRSDVINLRASERVPFFCVVEFSEDGARWSTGFSYDISAGGIFIRTLNPARPGRQLLLRARLAGRDEPRASTGVVAWANTYWPRSTTAAPVGMGIRLVSLSPQLKSHIAGLMQSLEGAAPAADERS